MQAETKGAPAANTEGGAQAFFRQSFFAGSRAPAPTPGATDRPLPRRSDCNCLQIKALSFSERLLAVETGMARTSNSLDSMSYAELSQMQARIERLKIEKQNNERSELRQRIIEMVKEQGFEIQDIFGKGRKGKGSVAVRYRDPRNPENTWTGRGRMPRWLVAATKGGKAKKEDFLA